MINISKLYCGLSSQSDHLRYARTNDHTPIVVYNCTARCNLKCIHCYSASNQGSGTNELTTAEAVAMLRSIVDYKCPVVLFSGGEPLLREDLFHLLRAAVKLGLRTVISTNGTLIDAVVAKRLARLRISYVGISLDGPQNVHDIFRAKQGSFAAALAGIANCSKAGVKTGLRFTITRQNHKYVSSIFDIARQTGVRRICFYHLVRAGRGTELANQTLTRQQTRGVLDIIIAKTDEFVKAGLLDEMLTVGNHADGPYLLLKMLAQKNPLYNSAREFLLANGGNRSGQNIASIGWDGSVYADQFWRNYSLGNIKQKSFAEIWDNDNEPVLKMLRNKNEFADPRCKRCSWFAVCKGNFRFLGSNPSIETWLLEPPCYLTDEEIESGGYQ
jgi:radical SAM protein with 4Fe4S-binding SPASM domain